MYIYIMYIGLKKQKQKTDGQIQYSLFESKLKCAIGLQEVTQNPKRCREKWTMLMLASACATAKPIKRQLADQQINPLARCYLWLQTNVAIVDVNLPHLVTSDSAVL